MLQRVLSLFAVLLVVAALACVGAGTWIRHEMTTWIEGTLTTTGVVEEMVEAKAISADGYAARVVYEVNGQEVRFIGAPASVQHLKQGEQVTVLYHPQDPKDAGIAQERTPSWFVPLFFVGTGVFLLLVAAVTWQVARGIRTL
jgi:hypothetical protein